MRRLLAAVLAVAGMAAITQPAHAGTWTPLFEENFDTPAALGTFNSVYGNRFDNYDGFTDTTKHGTYSTAKTLSVHDGYLDIWLHSERAGNAWKHYVAALLPKWPCATGYCSSLTYASVQVNFRVPKPAAGYKTAWLLWPDSGQWPGDGEIDFPESCTDLTGHICWATHFAQSDPSMQDVRDVGSAYTDRSPLCAMACDLHAAEVWWQPNETNFFFDGTWLGETNADIPHGLYIPDDPMHFVLQTETATDGSVPTNAAQGHVLVDSIEIWDYNP